MSSSGVFIKYLKDENGNKISPVTSAMSVYMEGTNKTVNGELAKWKSILTTTNKGFVIDFYNKNP